MSEKELILRIKAAVDAGGFNKVRDHIDKIGGAAQTAGRIAAAGMAVATGAVIGLGVMANNATMKFDASLSELAAVGGPAAVASMDELRAKALQIGKDTAFSAGEAANALVELSKAGLTTEQILGGAADATVALAAAGGIDVPQAAEIASAAMNQFGLAASDLPRVADLLAGAANASATDVGAMGESLQNVGATAKIVGLSIDDTSTALAALAKIGITGGEAGSTLNRALLSMASPSKEAAAMMKELGFSAFDATGKLKDLPTLAGELRGSLDDLDPDARAAALSTMFSSFGMKAGAALFEAGADGINQIAEAMNGVSAADVASQKLDNLAGAVTIMKGSFETFLIVAGSAFQPMMKGIVEQATNVINGLMPIVELVGKDFAAVFGDAATQTEAFSERVGLMGEDLTNGGEGVSGLRDLFQSLKDKLDEVKVAFEDGGIVGALSEIVGFDLQPIIDGFIATKDAVIELGTFLLEHKGLVLATAAAFLIFKGALAINKAVETASAALTAAKAAWAAYRSGVALSTIATQLFGVTAKVAMGPIGWIIMALVAGAVLLYAAWKSNFGGIQEKTKAVVEFLKGVPDMVAAGWRRLVEGVSKLVQEWRAKWDGLSGQTKGAIKAVLTILFPFPLLFTKVGRDTVQGLWNGMKAIWSKVTGWLKDAGGKLISGAKAVFGIKSPSTVFFSIGRWLMEGFALGINAAAGLVFDAVDAVTGSLAELAEANAALIPAQAAVDVLAARIHAARMAFLSGGQAEPGSLAWLMGQWGEPPDFGAVFASLNIPVADVAAFTALLTRLASEGEMDQVADLWGRFYDSMIEHENAYHAAQMKRIEDGAAAAKKAHDDAQKAMADVMELEKRHFDWVKDQEAQAAAKPGGDPVGQKTKFFSDDVDRIKLKMADALAFLGFEGPKALANFWKAYVGDANASITTTEDLSKAIDAIISEVGKRWSEQAAQLEEQWAATAASEKDRHDATIKMLDEQAKFIDTLIASEGQAQEVLNALIAERDRLLAAAREAIKAAQEAEEERETRIHDGVMANIDAQRKAWTTAHNDRMAKLEAERASQERFHDAIIQDLQDQRAAIDVAFEAREQAIDNMRADLLQLKLDLGVDAAVAELVKLKDALGEVKRVMDSFEVQPIGRADLDRQRKAQTERVRATTDEQRAMLEKARDSGLLSQDQLRTVQMLLLGYKQKATDVAAIFAILETSMEDQVKAQQAVVDSNQKQIEAAEAAITAAETLLSIDRTRAQTQILDIERRIKAEDDRWKVERARLDAGIAAEEAAFKAQMDFLDEVEAREAQRHAQRMSDIAGEYALMLASLGMSQAEIDGIIAAAQKLAQQIADETEALFRRIMQDAPKAEEILRIGADDPEITKRIRPPRGETPPTPGPGEGGRGGGGIRPKGTGTEIVVEGGASITEGTIESVTLGGVSVEGTEVYVTIDGRLIAAEVVDAIVGNVTITDRLGAALNERAARTP